MPIVFGCVVPHGFSLIPDVSEDAEGGLQTREAMFALARRCRAANPDVLVIATPHGFRVNGTICLADVARAAGSLTRDGHTIELNIPVDGALTDEIAEAARARDVPIALGGFGGNRRDQSGLPLDWGTLTPAWFLGHQHNMTGYGNVLADAPQDDGPPVVIAAPSRALPRQAMVEFGKAVAEAAQQDGRRVAFVASCDWAHAHAESGPYGFHPDAAEVDQIVIQALKDNDPLRLIDLPDDKVRHASIDGLWQTLMLGGVEQLVPMKSEVLSYQVPTYYGMIVAAFEPTGSAA